MKKRFNFPDTISFILIFMALFLLLTWIIPAGEYQREVKNGRNIIVKNTYSEVKPAPQGIWAFLKAPIKGMESAASIIALVFLIGGSFGVVNKTNAINQGLKKIVLLGEKKSSFKLLILPLIMILFSLAGATIGMSEEVLVFVIITVPMALSLGYDSVVGVSVAFVAAGVGFAGAFLNPFTVGIAQEIAEIKVFSGIAYRLVVWCVLTFVTILFVMRYALLLQKGKIISVMSAVDNNRNLEEFKDGDNNLTLNQKIVLSLLLTVLVLLVLGVTFWEWYIDEIAGLFIALAILSAIIVKIKAKIAVDAFLEGAKEMMVPALVIGLTKGLFVIATEGKIIDTILYAVETLSQGLPRQVSIIAMFIFQGVLNFFMPSGSGQAALTMPVMAPLSDILGISRQLSVLAFQLGDGLVNLMIPTSGVTMGVLSIAKIPFNKWFRWIMPLMLILFVLSAILLVIPLYFFTWN